MSGGPASPGATAEPTATAGAPDPFAPSRALDAEGVLAPFNAAGVLTAADVHVARRLAALADEDDETVLLACALAVRAPRLGHVCIDLATVRTTVSADVEAPVDLQALPWPEPRTWQERLAGSSLVGGADGPADRPLRLTGTRLYLDRYWRQEQAIAADLRTRHTGPAEDVRGAVLEHGLARLFPATDAGDPQRRAGETAVRRRLAVIAGGPGTGKTTTVARVLALLDEQAMAAGAPPPRVALAAPTGKAAARLEEAVHDEARDLDVADATRARLLAAEASTLHRLLGWRPDNRSRFRHDRTNRLPHDVVVVDETSMVSLSLMARLVEAVRPQARLVLVGDPHQLASVEAGAVLGDLVGPAAEHAEHAGRADRAEAPERGEDDADARGAAAEAGSPLGEAVVTLRRVHRFTGGIAALAGAVQRGAADEALRVLRDGGVGGDVRFVEADVAEAAPLAELAPLRTAVTASGERVLAAARAGDGRAALDEIGRLRVLCAHRRGAYGAQTWMRRIERWLAAAVEGYGAGGRWYLGRPLLVTENDYGLGLYNGDTGVVVADGRGGVTAVFQRRGEVLAIAPGRLASVDTVHAMTVHKSQGSQFPEVAVLLPDAASPLLTRELLHTAVTRAERLLTVVGTESALRTAVVRPIARASGLAAALRGSG